ncbi:unnamed protein product, partial [marine sediment metagenome]
PSSGIYTDDITGGSRTSPWDIGAYEVLGLTEGNAFKVQYNPN